MSQQMKGGFRPPPIGNILWKCPECDTFNAAEADTCKKCGAAKVITDDIAGATYKPIDESERQVTALRSRAGVPPHAGLQPLT